MPKNVSLMNCLLNNQLVTSYLDKNNFSKPCNLRHYGQLFSQHIRWKVTISPYSRVRSCSYSISIVQLLCDLCPIIRWADYLVHFSLMQLWHRLLHHPNSINAQEFWRVLNVSMKKSEYSKKVKENLKYKFTFKLYF